MMGWLTQTTLVPAPKLVRVVWVVTLPAGPHSNHAQVVALLGTTIPINLALLVRISVGGRVET